MTKTTTLCLLLLTMLSLSACSSIWPDPFYIEYDEEVKLHTGEIIVVHIKRQYTRGDAIPAIWQRKPSFAWAGPVEITWDTGFAGVGKKTVQFKILNCIEKFENTWFVCGGYSDKNTLFSGNVRQDKGNRFGAMDYLVAINAQGEYVRFNDEMMVPNITYNIISELSADGLPYFYSGKTVTFGDKLKIEQTLPKHFRMLGKKYHGVS